MQTVKNITSATNLENEITKASGKLVVVDFSARWCLPCKKMAPTIDAWAKQFSDKVFLKVDIDACEDLANLYQIKTVPTFVFIRDDKIMQIVTGTSTAKLLSAMQKY